MDDEESASGRSPKNDWDWDWARLPVDVVSSDAATEEAVHKYDHQTIRGHQANQCTLNLTVSWFLMECVRAGANCAGSEVCANENSNKFSRLYLRSSKWKHITKNLMHSS